MSVCDGMVDCLDGRPGPEDGYVGLQDQPRRDHHQTSQPAYPQVRIPATRDHYIFTGGAFIFFVFSLLIHSIISYFFIQ